MPGEGHAARGGWLRRLFGRPTATDPAGELERERRLAEAARDRDRMQDVVLETDGHDVMRGGAAGGLPVPRGEVAGRPKRPALTGAGMIPA